jgi:ribonuclease E
MSRQRIRTGVLEGSTVVCSHCQGSGVVRSTASIALHVLRVLEDALIKSSTHDLTMRTRTAVALYILNQKRANLRDLERRFGVAIAIEADDTLTGANYHAIERGEPATGVKSEAEPVKPLPEDVTLIEEAAPVEAEEEEALEPPGEESEESARASDRGGGSEPEDGEVGRRRRRRRRRRGGERSFGDNLSQDAPQPTDDGLAVVAEIGGDLVQPSVEADAFDRRPPRGDEDRRRRSRGSRGERNRFRRRDWEGAPEAGAPGFDSPRSPTLEEEFAASEADYSAAPPPADDAIPPEETMAEPGPAAAAQAVEVETPAPGAEPIGRSAPAEADDAAEATPDPASTAAEEPPRPRRSGWWQRARATVIGK